MTRHLLQLLLLAACGSLLSQPARADFTHRVSVPNIGLEADDESLHSSISADGRFVAFESEATNLIAGDNNGSTDIFVRDRQTHAVERVSIDSNGAETIGGSINPSISADGRFVAFGSGSADLVAGDNNASDDIFVHDRGTGGTERVSVASNGVEGDDYSFYPSISADGRFVAFESFATNLVASDNNSMRDVFVHDRQTNVTERVSVASNGVEGDDDSINPSISADGRFVAFEPDATNLVANDNNITRDVFVHDRQTGVTERASVSITEVEGNGASLEASISADGRFVAFRSAASNLVFFDTNSDSDIFVRDRLTGATYRVSVNTAGFQGNDTSSEPSISPNGRFVAFQSNATNLVSGDSNGTRDIFVYDRLISAIERVSVDPAGFQGNSASTEPFISATGRFVAFESDATNLILGDGNGSPDIFLRDRGLQPDGHDDLLVDFGGAGLWQRMNDSAWTKIHKARPSPSPQATSTDCAAA